MHKHKLTPSEELRQRMTGKTEFQFAIGNLANSERILDIMEKDKTFDDFVWGSFTRHCTCDWGDIDEESRKANNQAIKKGGCLFSEYIHPEYGKLCILTENDRATTVIGLSDEFYNSDC